MSPPTGTKEPALHWLDVAGCAVYADEIVEGLDIHLDFTTGGDEDWMATSALSPVYGGDAARSSYCLNEPSWMQTSEERVFSDCRLSMANWTRSSQCLPPAEPSTPTPAAPGRQAQRYPETSSQTKITKKKWVTVPNIPNIPRTVTR